MNEIINKILNIDQNILSTIISAGTSIIILFITGLGKFIYDRYSVTYRLKKEYKFEQISKIKNELGITKTRLLNAGEELSNRLWNFSKNINEEWHIISKADWKKIENYYFQSFIYRILVFLYYIFYTDNSVNILDSTIINKNDNDIIYIKYIKTFKNIFSDILLLKEFKYTGEPATNHIFKDNFDRIIKYIKKENTVLSYSEYLEKIKINNDDIEEIMRYIVNIKHEKYNINWNVIMEFHLILITFLNKFGHDYQKSSKIKISCLIKENYKHNIYNKIGFIKYIKRCKMENELKLIIRLIKKNENIKSNDIKDGDIN